MIAIEFLWVKISMLLSLANTQLNSVGCQHKKVLSFERAASDDGEKIKKPEKFNLKDWQTTVRIEG